jgi:hypothetical protein
MNMPSPIFSTNGSFSLRSSWGFGVLGPAYFWRACYIKFQSSVIPRQQKRHNPAL